MGLCIGRQMGKYVRTVVLYLEARWISPSILVERLYIQTAIETCFIVVISRAEI